MTEEVAQKMPERLDVALPGLDGLVVTHHLARGLTDSGLPTDGQWYVLHAASKLRINRASFRTLHAAAHYAHRLVPITDWTVAEIDSAGLDSNAVLHAEAHAHEVDATYPAGRIWEAGDGTSMVDEVGDLARFFQQAPTLQFKPHGEVMVCTVCGDWPVIWMEWMNAEVDRAKAKAAADA